MKRRTRSLPQSPEGNPLIPILNLVCMLIPLLLYGAVFVKFKTIVVKQQTPGLATDAPPEPLKERLNLHLTITERGFHLAVHPKHRLDWMQASATATGAAEIPAQDGQFDYRGLKARLAEIKGLHPDEERLYLTAEDDIPFDVIVQTMDSARLSAGGWLFPDVMLVQRALL